jgi:hypothetical protein
LVDRLASPNTVIADRIKALLIRDFASELFSKDPTAWEELVVIYDEHFRYGVELRNMVCASNQLAALGMRDTARFDRPAQENSHSKIEVGAGIGYDGR